MLLDINDDDKISMMMIKFDPRDKVYLPGSELSSECFDRRKFNEPAGEVISFLRYLSSS